MRSLEERYVRAMAYVLRHRWVAPAAGLLVISSTVYPFLRIDKNFDMTRTEVFIQVRYEFAEELSLERREQVIDRVETVVLPLKDELQAKSIYSFWSNEYSMMRIYMADGHANERAMNATRARLREVLPELPGVKLEVVDQRQGWGGHRG